MLVKHKINLTYASHGSSSGNIPKDCIETKESHGVLAINPKSIMQNRHNMNLKGKVIPLQARFGPEGG